MKKIKICYIINNLGQGGAERQFVELIKYIDKNKFDVELCIYAYNNRMFYNEVMNDCRIKVTLNVLKSKNKIIKIIEAVKYINRYLNKNNFDIIHTTLFMNGFLVRVAGVCYANKLISTIRNSFSIYKIQHRIVERILLNISIVIANTNKAALEFRKTVSKKKAKRIFAISNGIDTVKFQINEVRRENKTGPLIIGSVGRITYQKNQIQLCRIIKDIDAKLIIVGEKEKEYDKINNYLAVNNIENKVTIIEKTNQPEKYYNMIDIFILTSFWEGSPNVLFEAMLCGCFCIISKNANTDEFVINNNNGVIYDGSDYDLKIKLNEVIGKYGTEEYRKIIEEGINYVKRKMSVKNMIDLHEKLYIDIYNKMLPL